MVKRRGVPAAPLRGGGEWLLALASVICLVSPGWGQEGLRRVHVGDTMPEFSLTDARGTVFRYEHKQARVLGILILQAGQTHLQRLVTDLEVLVQKLRVETLPTRSPDAQRPSGPGAGAFDCIGVMSGSGTSEFLRSRDPDAGTALPIVADPNFAFWGKLGVIAAPTAIVVGADHKVRWIKAGFGYDFVAGFHSQLNEALGLGGSASATAHVQTLENTSVQSRRDRHIQLARVLAKKARWESALGELEKARALDPNAADVALELGEILCRTGKNEAALTTVAQVKAESAEDKAHVLLVSAWAKRQMGDLGAAESLLTRALEISPESPRILYELGKVHQAKGDAAKALACYRRALAEVFGDTEPPTSSQK
ncbi:MAG: tetratricopeptide repeat protein [Planctomycetes bacterium]|nr:tetratricopeptide repeat protein [Planctomycetota bacterium]